MISSIKLNVPKARRLCDRLNYSRAAHQVASGIAAVGAPLLPMTMCTFAASSASSVSRGTIVKHDPRRNKVDGAC